MVNTCKVCNENEQKYKCKTCKIPYCSLGCYATHQNQPCEPPAATDCAPETPGQNGSIPKKPLLFSTVDTVPMEKLELLGQSEQLRNLLYNPHLRRLLTEVDTAPNGMNAIRVAMMEPLFVEFADECMKLVEGTNDEPEEIDWNEPVFTNRQHRR